MGLNNGDRSRRRIEDVAVEKLTFNVTFLKGFILCRFSKICPVLVLKKKKKNVILSHTCSWIFSPHWSDPTFFCLFSLESQVYIQGTRLSMNELQIFLRLAVTRATAAAPRASI